jgi:hypothetical protein
LLYNPYLVKSESEVLTTFDSLYVSNLVWVTINRIERFCHPFININIYRGYTNVKHTFILPHEILLKCFCFAIHRLQAKQVLMFFVFSVYMRFKKSGENLSITWCHHILSPQVVGRCVEVKHG